MPRGLDINAFDHFLRRMTRTPLEELGRGDYDRDIVEATPCRIGWTFARITADGLAGPCLKGDKKPMGTIYEKRFSELWYSEKWNEFRARANSCSKFDPYFKTLRCHATCDNLGDNLGAQKALQSLGAGERVQLHLMRAVESVRDDDRRVLAEART